MVLSVDALLSSAPTPPVSIPGSPFHRTAASSEDGALYSLTGSRDEAMLPETAASDVDQSQDDSMEMSISLPTNSNLDSTSFQPTTNGLANALGRMQSHALASRPVTSGMQYLDSIAAANGLRADTKAELRRFIEVSGTVLFRVDRIVHYTQCLDAGP